MSDTSLISITGTLVKESQGYEQKFITLKSGDQHSYIAVADLRAPDSFVFSLNDAWDYFWYYFGRQDPKQLLFAINKKAMALIKEGKVCQEVVVKGTLNFSSGYLNVLDVEHGRKDIQLASRKY